MLSLIIKQLLYLLTDMGIFMKNEQLEEIAKELAHSTYNFFSTCEEKENTLAKLKGLTQVEYKCIRLFRISEVTNNKRISDKMKLSPSRLTRIIDGLVTKGFIKREIDREDRRNMRLYLSDTGCGFIENLNKEYVDLHCRMLENVKPEYRREVMKAVKSLFTELDKWYSAKSE